VYVWGEIRPWAGFVDKSIEPESSGSDAQAVSVRMIEHGRKRDKENEAFPQR
jgi:hypothetical protein